VPVWRVRAGDYISIADHPADVPRRIIETRYTHGGRQISLNLDNTPYALDAILARTLWARGWSACSSGCRRASGRRGARTGPASRHGSRTPRASPSSR
jgi:hypothetical protein